MTFEEDAEFLLGIVFLSACYTPFNNFGEIIHLF